MNMERQIIEVNSKWYDVIAMYHDDSNDKDYVIYSDGSKDIGGKLVVYYGSYVINNGKYEISGVDELEEKKILSLLETIIEEVNKK